MNSFTKFLEVIFDASYCVTVDTQGSFLAVNKVALYMRVIFRTFAANACITVEPITDIVRVHKRNFFSKAIHEDW